MDNVKRYEPEGSFDGCAGWMRPEIAGDWVSFEDYTALRARLEAVEKERDQADACNRGLVRLNDATFVRAERAEAALATARRDALEEAARMIEAIVKEAISENGPAKSSPDIAAVEMLKSIVSAIRALANEAETSARGMP